MTESEGQDISPSDCTSSNLAEKSSEIPKKPPTRRTAQDASSVPGSIDSGRTPSQQVGRQAAVGAHQTTTGRLDGNSCWPGVV